MAKNRLLQTDVRTAFYPIFRVGIGGSLNLGNQVWRNALGQQSNGLNGWSLITRIGTMNTVYMYPTGGYYNLTFNNSLFDKNNNHSLSMLEINLGRQISMSYVPWNQSLLGMYIEYRRGDGIVEWMSDNNEFKFLYSGFTHEFDVYENRIICD
jgi:hypothetical protein